MRIAFFGGSFDPPHSGHLRIAYAAAERLRLDRMLLAPVALQPLKREPHTPPPAPYADRVAMLRLLIAGAHSTPLDMQVSEIDAPRADGLPNYTYDTLVRLRAQSAPDDKLFVLLGADSFLSMRHWHRAPELLLLADWIVASRPGCQLSDLEQALPSGFHPAPPSEAPESPESHPGWVVQQLAAPDGRAATLYLLPDLHEDVSATGIRAALAAGAVPQPAEPRLAPSVVHYIRSHGLYR